MMHDPGRKFRTSLKGTATLFYLCPEHGCVAEFLRWTGVTGQTVLFLWLNKKNSLGQ